MKRSLMNTPIYKPETLERWIIPKHPPYYYLLEDYQDYKVKISLGSRGLGKTLHYKLRGIHHYLNTGRCFIYLRRFRDEIKEAKANFLKDIMEGDDRLSEFEWSINGNRLLCDGKTCGYFYALSTTLTKKSTVFNDVDMLIFDEFLTLGYTIRGGNEVTIFLEFLETVFRTRKGIEIILLSNAISTTSQYFEIFGFDKPLNPKRKFQFPKGKEKSVFCEIYNSKDWKEYKEETDLYSVLATKDYQKYSIENEFIFENTDNIISRKDVKGHLKLDYRILTKESMLSIYHTNDGRYYIDVFSPNENNEKVLTYTFDKELTPQGCIYLSTSSTMSMYITQAITSQCIFYSDMRVKKLFLENIKKIVSTYY